VRISKQRTASIRSLAREITALGHELERLITAHSPGLVGALGGGALTASTLSGRTADAERFPAEAHWNPAVRRAGLALARPGRRDSATLAAATAPRA
jgi:hypothetical protein